MRMRRPKRLRIGSENITLRSSTSGAIRKRRLVCDRKFNVKVDTLHIRYEGSADWKCPVEENLKQPSSSVVRVRVVREEFLGGFSSPDIGSPLLQFPE